jgi:hypothetical protein
VRRGALTRALRTSLSDEELEQLRVRLDADASGGTVRSGTER